MVLFSRAVQPPITQMFIYRRPCQINSYSIPFTQLHQFILRILLFVGLYSLQVLAPQVVISLSSPCATCHHVHLPSPISHLRAVTVLALASTAHATQPFGSSCGCLLSCRFLPSPGRWLVVGALCKDPVQGSDIDVHPHVAHHVAIHAMHAVHAIGTDVHPAAVAEAVGVSGGHPSPRDLGRRVGRG